MLGDVWFVAQTCAVAFTMLALCELAGQRRGALVGVWFALALGSRFTLVMALPVFAWWVWAGFRQRDERPPRVRLRALAAFALPLLLFFIGWIAYNEARWNEPWDAGHTIFYHQDPYMGSATGSPFGLGNVPMELWSFFVQPPAWLHVPPWLQPLPAGTALWFTSPALVLAFFARRPARLVASLWIAVALVAGPSLLYYANGGAQFGMRHALDFAPFAVVLMGLATQAELRPVVWRTAQALVVWSVAAGVWGCWYWNALMRHD